MIVSPAFAQTAAPAIGTGSPWNMLLMFGLMFGIAYFLLFRPQQQRVKQHKAMIAALKRGDRIVTGGGVIGTVTKVQDEDLTIEIAENVRIKILRSTVSHLLSKTEAADSSAKEKPADGANDNKGSERKRLSGKSKDEKVIDEKIKDEKQD